MLNHKDIRPLVPREISGNPIGCDMPQEEKDSSWEKIKTHINKKTVSILSPSEQLKQNGFVRLGKVLDAEKALGELGQFPIYNGHVKAYSDQQPIFGYNDKKLFPMIYSWDVADIFQCKTIMEVASSPLLVNFVGDYLGCLPTCYSMNCMLSVGPHQHGTLQRHRDQDDFKFVSLFIYLNDVDTGLGAHVYEKGTHLGNPTGQESHITGEAGEGFIADSWGFHRGGQIVPGGRRVCLWIRYGLYDNWTSRDCDKNFSTPVSLKHVDLSSEVNRYVFRFFDNLED